MGFGGGGGFFVRDPRPTDFFSFAEGAGFDTSAAGPQGFAGSPQVVPSPTGVPRSAVSILDAILDTAVDIGQIILRSVTPDPLEATIDVFFPDVARTIFGSARTPGRVFVDMVIGAPGAGATPPFFPSPLEPNVIQDPRPPLSIPGGVFDIPEAPGIFDDLLRGAIDILPELIPGFPDFGVIDAAPGVDDAEEVTFEDVEAEFPEAFEPFPAAPLDGLADFPIEGDFGLAHEDVEMAESDLGVCPPGRRLPQCITFAQWNELGRPEGYCADRGGFLRKRRTRRRRPLSQQAKDDLAWAKATFGGGKAFDNVVARMRL